MKLNGLIIAKFVQRYKRFFIDAKLPSGEIVVAHCPNTGSMKSLIDEVDEVWLRYDDNPKRKLKYTAEILKLNSGALALINTQRPNALVEEYLLSSDLQHTLPQDLKILEQMDTWKREVKYGSEKSKIDLYGSAPEDDIQVYLEVKNMTLMDQPTWGSFPDAKTERGQKHLRELMEVRSSSTYAVLCFLVSRTDIECYGVAQHIDPIYAELFHQAQAAGVLVWAPQLQYHVHENQGICDVEMTLSEAVPWKA